METVKVYDCEICCGVHAWTFNGDCRDDAGRYASPEDFCRRTGTPQEAIEVCEMTERLEADEAEA